MIHTGLTVWFLLLSLRNKNQTSPMMELHVAVNTEGSQYRESKTKKRFIKNYVIRHIQDKQKREDNTDMASFNKPTFPSELTSDIYHRSLKAGVFNVFQAKLTERWSRDPLIIIITIDFFFFNLKMLQLRT